MMSETDAAMRQRAWRRQRRASRRALCVCCGRLFIPTRADAGYCCQACRQLSYRRRRLSGIDAPRRPTDGPWLASASIGPPNTGATAEAAPGAALGPRPAKRGDKVIDVTALIG
jgi:hypothetical protein